MAACAGIGGTGVVALVACVAVVFDSCVCSGEGVSVVCKARRLSCGGGMTLLTIGTNFGYGMVWLLGLVVVGGMATGAGIRGIGVVALVAGVAVVFDSCVCSFDFIELIVYWEGGWIPTGVSGVALLAVEGYVECFMAGLS